jgi:hypothetical protein
VNSALGVLLILHYIISLILISIHSIVFICIIIYYIYFIVYLPSFNNDTGSISFYGQYLRFIYLSIRNVCIYYRVDPATGFLN